jgi:hypothetical protein
MTGPQAHAKNLDTIIRAAIGNRLALVEVRVRETGETRTALVAMSGSEDNDEIEMVPFALMVDGNPYELLDPPDPDGGFYAS